MQQIFLRDEAEGIMRVGHQSLSDRFAGMLSSKAIFGMDLLHTTLPNGTRSFRISCDTRWQPLEAGC